MEYEDGDPAINISTSNLKKNNLKFIFRDLYTH